MKLVLGFILIVLSTNLVRAQLSYDGKMGSGLRFKTKDNSFYLKYRTRIQTRWDFEYIPVNAIFQNRAYVKRARLKFDGYFINEDLRYKIEYDVVGGYVRDAVIKYRIGKFDFWFGQTKLPGNRERVVSSGNLQLVDRSVFNYDFTLDRDIGIQLHHHFYIGKVLVRDIYAVSSGGGILDNHMHDGMSYTAKLEILPFGSFTNKGDYKFADLYRESKPKLSIASHINFNKSAYKDRGQVGMDLKSKADLLLLGFDLYFKYSGYSALFEYGSRTVTKGNVIVYDDNGDMLGAYYVGKGLNFQTGYVFKSNWEISGRYASTLPEEALGFSEIQDITLGLSKYIIGHNFKIQTDFTLRQIQGESDRLIGRIQMEFQF